MCLRRKRSRLSKGSKDKGLVCIGTELHLFLKTSIVATFTWIYYTLEMAGALFLVFVGVMCLDLLTGFLAACKNGEWNSSAAHRGLWKKFGASAVVVCSLLLDLLLYEVVTNFPMLGLPSWDYVIFLPLTLVWYIITELGSILENAGKLGAKLPKILQKSISIFQSKLDNTKIDLPLGKDEKDEDKGN